ncbi:MAG TPA: hypothetical protein VNW15_14550 [Rhizomicrobium sp.]|nr:hypothetical protein [Rhizomicrobium sp.]
MWTYETRLANDGSLSLLSINNYASDFTAIRAAKLLCKDEETIEVWKDDSCIYAEAPRGIFVLDWRRSLARPLG